MIELSAKVTVSPGVLERIKAKLRGAPNKISAHRVTVGINEQEASAQAIKVASRKPNTNERKRDYTGKPTSALLIDVALAHEFGTSRLPDRSWLRTWFDTNLDRLKQEATDAMRAEYQGNKQAVPDLAAQWDTDMKDWIREGEAHLRELSERTKRARRESGLPEDPPLYATHQLVDAIRAIADGRYVVAK